DRGGLGGSCFKLIAELILFVEPEQDLRRKFPRKAFFSIRTYVLQYQFIGCGGYSFPDFLVKSLYTAVQLKARAFAVQFVIDIIDRDGRFIDPVAVASYYGAKIRIVGKIGFAPIFGGFVKAEHNIIVSVVGFLYFYRHDDSAIVGDLY